jgi:hypothetical protein
MKTKTLHILAIVALLAICARGQILRQRDRAALVDERMKSQMAAIKSRARDFMELHLHQPFFPAGETASFMSRYELCIRVPPENLHDFLDWMKGTSLEPARVEGWPSDFGQHVEFGTNELIYRVYYGDKPRDWD